LGHRAITDGTDLPLIPVDHGRDLGERPRGDAQPMWVRGLGTAPMWLIGATAQRAVAAARGRRRLRACR
jgi:hypothetical protein